MRASSVSCTLGSTKRSKGVYIEDSVESSKLNILEKIMVAFVSGHLVIDGFDFGEYEVVEIEITDVDVRQYPYFA